MTIRKTKEKTPADELVSKLLRSAEMRINFVYMMLMIAFACSLLIYVLCNLWDDTRFFLGAGAGGALLVGIIVNAVFYKKCYPWIKYMNTLVMTVFVFYLCTFSDLIAILFILIPLLNSFYLRPRLTVISGAICMFMTYIGIILMRYVEYQGNGTFTINLYNLALTGFNYTDAYIIDQVRTYSFLLIISASLVIVSVYLSVSSRKFNIRQAELMHKNLTADMELNVARNIQEGILSKDFPDNDSYAVYADMTTATEVGGDFYDYFLIDETHLAIVIGDVSGHGVAAAMFMTLAKTLIKVYAQSSHSTDKAFEYTNRYLLQSNPEKMFVTAWMGLLDLQSGVLSYTNAGHNPPVVLKKGRSPEFLRSKPNFVLGRRKRVRFLEERMVLSAGDKLLLYTDGVTEAQNSVNEMFGEERLIGVIGQTKEKSQKEIVEAVRGAVNDFEHGSSHYDDATLLALSYRDTLQVTPPHSKTFFLSKDTFDAVTDHITDECVLCGCDDAAVSEITIAVSEILANIDSYAYENGGEVEILTKCRDKRMSITFKDNGKPFNPLLVQEPDVAKPLSKRRPGGLGIFIVRKLMTETSYVYTNGQNVLTIEKDF